MRISRFLLIIAALLIQCGCQWPSVVLNEIDPEGRNAAKGKLAIARYGCASCHTIPGVHGASALVGPSLEHIANRTYIAGVLQNTRRNMLTWIQNPPGVDEKTAMPNLGISTGDAQDITSYLYTLQ